ncbi:TetR/AcrR family transcriptional regulator [Mycolicibacterium rhodesiae]|uniref:TetR family transcriptional regulator n=1 Tax=Mycolicibacterium rhodesiae TaxID=36814 RepID=A0A1X0J2K3_MYCRH|nr:TetR family transcriptional regulator [Mycolicibacterium rhodesiae]MCV7344557.1 TetR family transcriptional regulator [Mycolicibacterium rhodesiae]ORB55948.1 TetR family transcriptional regulator [Mycolicibacterium rhodesiae]
MSSAKDPRTDRSSITRDALLVAAERLFAENGLYAVSNRQISDAAGQGNNAAVCYHFGSRSDLLRAIEARHHAAIDEIRRGKLADMPPNPELRDWVGALVHPLTEHLHGLGTTTTYARFAAQVMADPACRELVGSYAMTSERMLKTVRGINRCLPARPRRVRVIRWTMARNLLMHTCAEIEGERATGAASASSGWLVVGEELVDALVGLWSAPDVAPRAGQVRVSSARSGSTATLAGS